MKYHNFPARFIFLALFLDASFIRQISDVSGISGIRKRRKFSVVFVVVFYLVCLNYKENYRVLTRLLHKTIVSKLKLTNIVTFLYLRHLK